MGTPKKRFFANQAEAQATLPIIVRSADTLISQFEVIGKFALAIVTTDAEFTLPTGVVVADDLYNSTGLKNLFILDDNGKLARANIVSTVGTTRKVITPLLDILLEENEVTPATLTDGKSYDAYILTPAQANYAYDGVYGAWMGYTDMNITPVEEPLRIEHGIPKKLVHIATISRGLKASGSTKMASDSDTLESVLGMTPYGTHTTKKVYGVGSDMASRKFFRVVMLTKDESDRLLLITIHKARFAVTGSIDLAAGETKKISYDLEALSNPFYPTDKADFYTVEVVG